MNPTISQAYIDKEIEKEPEAGRAEWLGLFREDVSAAFPLEVIEACIVPGRMEIPYSPHVGRYFAFLDPGGRHDAFTLAIAHQNYGSDKIILDVIKPHARRSIRQRWSKIINKLCGRIKLERHVFRLCRIRLQSKARNSSRNQLFLDMENFLGETGLLTGKILTQKWIWLFLCPYPQLFRGFARSLSLPLKKLLLGNIRSRYGVTMTCRRNWTLGRKKGVAT